MKCTKELINTNNKMILPSGTLLYRYCLGDNIPENWSTLYHSPEYHSSKYGDKNQVGALFFYKNEETARNVLGIAVKNSEKRGDIYNVNTITSCQTKEDINLLDITGRLRPVQILNVLYDEGIDVLTHEFVRHLNGDQTFDTIREYHQYIIDHDSENDLQVCMEKLNSSAKIDEFFQSHVGYTGQLMTDFGNGFVFKRLLAEKGYEGYQFMEEDSSPTICLLDSLKITKPVHKVVR